MAVKNFWDEGWSTSAPGDYKNPSGVQQLSASASPLPRSASLGKSLLRDPVSIGGVNIHSALLDEYDNLNSPSRDMPQATAIDAW